MKFKKITTIVLAGLLSVVTCFPVLAADETAIDSAGNVSAAGGNVNMPSEFFGGLAAGQEINIKNAEAEGLILAAGMNINIADTNAEESVCAAGMNINLSNTKIHGNVYAAGNSISFGEGSKANAVYFTGNALDYSGESRCLNAAGDTVSIYGTVDGDANIEANMVTIGADTVITGELKIKSQNEPVIEDGAQIAEYSFEQVEVDEGDDKEEASAIKNAAIAGIGASIGAAIGKGLYWILAMAAFGMILVWFFNNSLENAKEMVKTKTAPMIVSGLVTWLCVPLAAILMCVTAALAPAAGIMAIGYIMLLCAGVAFAGASLSRLVFPKMNVFLSALIGIAVLEVVLMIPVLGTLVGIAADMYLLGYVVQSIWNGRLQKKAE